MNSSVCKIFDNNFSTAASCEAGEEQMEKVKKTILADKK